MKLKISKIQKICLIMAVSFLAVVLIVGETWRYAKMRGMVVRIDEKLCISIPPKCEYEFEKGEIRLVCPEGKALFYSTKEELNPVLVEYSINGETSGISFHVFKSKKEVRYKGVGLNLTGKTIEGEVVYPSVNECPKGRFGMFLKKWSH
ncbi:MAG: hypothetical protein ACO20H_13720 [Bacteriovoracaceae bacterium]